MPLDANVEVPEMPVIFALRESYPNPVIQCLTLLDRLTFGEVHSDRNFFDVEVDQRNKMRLCGKLPEYHLQRPALTE